MLDKLAQIETRYEELTNELSSPELLSNPSAYAKAAKQHRSLGEIVNTYRAHMTLQEELNGARELGVDLEEHIAFCVKAMQDRAGELGLEGMPAAAG